MPRLVASQASTDFTIFADCFGCEDRRDFTCDVEVDAGTILVRTSVEVRETDEPCAAVCNQPRETCTLPPLEPGTYEVTFQDGQGGWSAEVEVGDASGMQECRADGIDEVPPEERDHCPGEC